MTFKRILSDALDTSTLIYHGNGGDTYTIQEVQDCEDIIEWNKKIANEGEMQLQVRTDKAAAAAVTARMLAELPVADLSVEDPPLEFVIDQVFHRNES